MNRHACPNCTARQNRPLAILYLIAVLSLLSWSAVRAQIGGSGINNPGGQPAGSNTQVQFNNNGAFGASANLTTTTNGATTLTAGTAGTVPGTFQLHSGQTADAIDVLDSTGAPVFTVGPTGVITIPGNETIADSSGNMVITNPTVGKDMSFTVNDASQAHTLELRHDGLLVLPPVGGNVTNGGIVSANLTSTISLNAGDNNSDIALNTGWNSFELTNTKLAVTTNGGTSGDILNLNLSTKAATFGGNITYAASAIKTTTYIVLSSDSIVLVDANGGSFTVTLPSTVTVGQSFQIIDANTTASAHTVTLAAGGTTTLVGASTTLVDATDDGKSLFVTGIVSGSNGKWAVSKTQ